MKFLDLLNSADEDDCSRPSDDEKSSTSVSPSHFYCKVGSLASQGQNVHHDRGLHHRFMSGEEEELLRGLWLRRARGRPEERRTENRRKVVDGHFVALFLLRHPRWKIKRLGYEGKSILATSVISDEPGLQGAMAPKLLKFLFSYIIYQVASLLIDYMMNKSHQKCLNHYF